MLSKLSIFCGLVLLVAGGIALPSPPASPEAIQASQAGPAFFFGGALLICGFFARANPRHGGTGIFLLAVLGLCTPLLGLVTGSPQEKSGNPWVSALLILSCLVLFSVALAAWRKSRQFRPDEEADEEKGEKEA
ncbi:MAG: hypothetical protein ACQKBY_03330 [Verrucomicrobiales bacterium]